MPIEFPRKFTRGQRVGDADVYAELFVWPGGYFQYTTHIRSRHATDGVCVNVRFALLDAGGTLLGTYGMPAGEEWCLAPQGQGTSSERHGSLFGQVPPEALARAEAVALVFGRANETLEPRALAAMANSGEELHLCPVPD